MNTPRILLTSVAALLAPFAVKVHAQLVIDPSMTFVQEGGFLGAGNLGTGGTAFALDLIGGGIYAPTHTIFNVNNGTFGNASSWIGDSPASFVGIGFGGAQTIASFAFGRDNLGAFFDRAVGLYTVQFTTDADPAVNFGTATWNTIGTINMDLGTGVASPTLRHRFNLVTPVSATGFRLIAPNGAAIDELELFATAGISNPLEINPAAGFTVTWDGNDGDHFNLANPAPVPRNLATTATAVTSSDLGPAIAPDFPFHRNFNLNDGFYGNDRSWIGNNPNPTAAVVFAGARHVSSVAWGRDNGNNAEGQTTDRSAGTYTLQSLDPTDNTTWVTLGAFFYNETTGDAVPGGDFTRWLRHQYSVATAGGGIRSAGIRLIVPTGNAIDELEVYASTMTWTNAAATGKWNLEGDANFSGAADAKFLTEDNVLFGNTAAGAVTLEGNLYPSSVTVDSSSDYTFIGTGSITGAGSLTKAGTGTLTLSGANTYTGGTTFNGGTVALGNAGALGTSGTLSFGGGTLQFSASNTTDYSGRISTAAGQAVSIDTNGQTVTFATGLTSAGGSLTKSGAGTLILSGFNTYDGATTVNGGTVSLQNAAVSTLSTVIIGNGATLSTDVASGINRRNLAGDVTLTGGTLGGNANISDTAAGQFLLTNDGAGQQVIVSGDNQSTISAEMHVAGTHVFEVADGAAAVDLLVTGKLSHWHGVAWGGIKKTGSGTMHLASSMDGTNSDGATGIYGLGGFELAGGTLLFSGSLGYSPFGPGSKVGYFLADFSANSTLKWDTGNTNDPSVNGNLRIRDGVNATLDTNGNTVVLSNAVVNGDTGTGALTKAGSGTLTLVGNSTYSGGTTIDAGTLQLGNGGASGDIAGSITNNGTFVFKRGDDFTFGGAIGGTGGVVQDGFIVRLTAAQTYSGPTQINAGGYLVLPLTLDQGLNASTVVTVAAGGNFDLSSRALTIAGLDGGGTVYSFNTNTGSLTLDVATGQTHDFSGTLGASFPDFAVTKAGLGMQILSGSYNYTGLTTVTGGILSLRNAVASNLFSVTIGNGGTLSTDVASGVNQRNILGNLTLTGGTLAGNANVSDSNTGQFLLNGAQQVIVSGNNQSTISAELHVAGTHTFDVADGTAPVDLLVTGKLSHWHTVAWGGIQKTGSGTMFLDSSMDGTNSAGANGIYGLGGFELAGGTLIFSGSLGYSAFDPANKVGYFLADFSADSTLKWAAGNTMDVSVNGNLRVRDGVNATLDTNGNHVTLGTAIVVGASQTGSLTKTGDGTLALLGAQPYATLNTEDGRTDLANVLGTGTSTINANAETNISFDQTLEALNIGPGAVVTIGHLPPPAPALEWAASPGDDAGVAAVPEPGSAALLVGGMLSLLAMRRRRL